MDKSASNYIQYRIKNLINLKTLFSRLEKKIESISDMG
jgi:hypothetical protein